MKKKEFSRLMCIIASSVFVLIGCWMIYEYYALIRLAIENGSDVVPDVALPIAGITSILVPFISYLIYQFKLKNSRNKYGISENGVPYCMPDESVEDSTTNLI
jgi:hypothetical protein